MQSEENVEYLKTLKLLVRLCVCLLRACKLILLRGLRRWPTFRAERGKAHSSRRATVPRLRWHRNGPTNPPIRSRRFTGARPRCQDKRGLVMVLVPQAFEPAVGPSRGWKLRAAIPGTFVPCYRSFTCAHHEYWQRSENYFPAIENLPDVRGYATNDLFIPHPTKKGLWKM